MDLVAPSANERSDERVGTRFWIFPQAPFIPGYEKPDRIWLPILADEVWDGPSDNAMYVADPLFDKLPYGTTSLPPFDGARRAPLRSGPDRNFDNLDWDSRAFLAAHAYACARFVLGIWQSYLGHPVRWFFEERYRAPGDRAAGRLAECAGRLRLPGTRLLARRRCETSICD